MEPTICYVDISKATSITEIHNIFKVSLNFPSYYGYNLDALHDQLTQLRNVDLRITFHKESHTQSSYMEKILKVLESAVTLNTYFSFQIN
ncbi:MAG: barstar family protein [Anaerotignaceae bacterium]